MEAVGSTWWHGASSSHFTGSRRGCIRQRHRNLFLCTLCVKGLQKVPSPCKQGRSDGVDGNIPARNKVSVAENLGCRAPPKRRHLALCERILAPCLAMLLLSGMLQPTKGSTAFRASPLLRHGRSESLSLSSNMHDVEDLAIVEGHSKGNIAGSASLSPQFSSEIDAVHEMSDEDQSESGKALSGLMGRKDGAMGDRVFESGSPGSFLKQDSSSSLEVMSGWKGLEGQTNGDTLLGLESAWSCLPHPVKAYRGGEDVHMVVNVNGMSLIGVFDGVGGWADLGIDPALYAREMAAVIEKELRRAPEQCRKEERPLIMLLQAAFDELERQELPGSCTACLALYTGDGQLHVLNLGDSGIHVVRDGLSVFCTNEQQHYFNCPFQLGMGSDDTPRDADYYVLEDIAAGDVIIAATDGVWDNVYEEDMVRLIAKHKSPKLVAEALGSLSQTHGQDGGYMSPFAANAMRQGLRYLGGKLDDVTVVVARVGALNGPGDFLSPVSSSEEADKKCSE